MDWSGVGVGTGVAVKGTGVGSGSRQATMMIIAGTAKSRINEIQSVRTHPRG
jgi:hypothetical protein